MFRDSKFRHVTNHSLPWPISRSKEISAIFGDKNGPKQIQITRMIFIITLYFDNTEFVFMKIWQYFEYIWSILPQSWNIFATCARVVSGWCQGGLRQPPLASAQIAIMMSLSDAVFLLSFSCNLTCEGLINPKICPDIVHLYLFRQHFSRVELVLSNTK